MTHFFIHNSFHGGDVILTRAVIQAIRMSFSGAKITLECDEVSAYLWQDLDLAIALYQGSEYKGTEPTPNCPDDAIFVNMWFGVFDDILKLYGMTYQNNVHTFNRQMYQHRLNHQYLLPIPIQTPTINFFGQPENEIEVRESSILVENGEVFSNQSYFYLNEHLKQIASDFPQLNFYCSAPPKFTAANIFDCSGMNLKKLSQVGEKCIGLLMKGSAINAACQTEINRYKPRCIVGWDLAVKLWDNLENPVVYAKNYGEVKEFILKVSSNCNEVLSTSKKHITIPSDETNYFPDAAVKRSSRCKFLKNRAEIDECTQYLKQNSYVSHSLICKDWDLANILVELTDGNFLDMGSSDSYMLKNTVLKGIKGEKYGIDFRNPDVPVAGVKYIVGNLMATGLPDSFFQNITCLSVIEHEVDFNKFAKEAFRLLANDGKLYVTFDYWTPKIVTGIKLYGLEWNVLDKNDVLALIQECLNNGLYLVDEIDWSLEEPIISEWSPDPAKYKYTFGMLIFQKKVDVVQNETPNLSLYKTPIGNYYLPTNVEKDVIVNYMKAGRIFEPEIVEVAKQYITEGSTVLDVGANFGQMTLFFSQFVGEKGRVISFEADDFSCSVLEKNIAANSRTNIMPICKAVYNKSGEVMFYPVPDFKRFSAYGSYGLDPNAKQGRKVETLAIDSLNIQSPISFMKVDVQGSDLFVLQGAIETIRRHQMPIIFEYEEQFQEEFKTCWSDYLGFIELVDYKVEKVVNNINYLIVPKKVF